MRVLVTGASGFVGAHLCAEAMRTGFDVVAAVRKTSRLDRLNVLAPNIHTVHLDITDANACTHVLGHVRPNMVLHGAAYGVDARESDDVLAETINVQGSLNLVRAAWAHDVKMFVHIGTCFEYGVSPQPIPETAALAPTTIYGMSKAKATQALMSVPRSPHRALTVVRPFAMWGPYEGTHKLVPQVITACLTQTPLALTAGEQLRDYTYVEDAARWILALAQAAQPGAAQVYNVASGLGITIRAWAEQIALALGAADALQFGKKPSFARDIGALVGDTTKLQRTVRDLHPTPFDEALQRTAASFAPT